LRDEGIKAATNLFFDFLYSNTSVYYFSYTTKKEAAFLDSLFLLIIWDTVL